MGKVVSCLKIENICFSNSYNSQLLMFSSKLILPKISDIRMLTITPEKEIFGTTIIESSFLIYNGFWIIQTPKRIYKIW